MSEENNSSRQGGEAQRLKCHVPQDLEYVYRDIFNVYVGAGDVVIEFGNHHRSMPEHATISNRIVMSVSSAYTLMQTMQQALHKAHDQLQKNLAGRGGS
ncbi:MAG: DUF3467 domain-containing protein [Desulfosalsimonas sp.]